MLACGPDGAVVDGGGESGGDDTPASIGGTSTGDADASTSADTTSAIDESTSGGSSESGDAVALCLHREPLAAIAGTLDAIAVADVDGDGRAELWQPSQTWDPAREILTQGLVAYVASPDGSADEIADATFEGAFQRFMDIDGDGHDDVVARSLAGAGDWFWLAGRDDATFAGEPQPISFPAEPPAFLRHAYDGDGDGDVDLFTQPPGEPGDPVLVLWLGDGTGGFATGGTLPIATEGSVEHVARTPEAGVFIVDASNGAVGFGVENTLFRVTIDRDGTMTTVAQTEPASQNLLAARDLDGDAATDLLVSGSEQEIHGWRAVGLDYERVLLAENARTAHAGDFLGEGTTQVLVGGSDDALVLLHAPLDPAGLRTPVDGELDSSEREDIDVDADGRTELLERGYDSEAGYSYSIAEVVPCG
ncbi:MAG TPA: hypothetical protein VFG69_01940 [Nannocystaceae bacterium]|nr:hypothetical protein [Nannocystaceae bacterium]